MPNTPLYDEIQELAAQYPVRRSAIMPALHAAQKQYGWLSPEALQEVADALDLTPGYCQAVASFYDCLLYTSPSPRDRQRSRMPSSA